MYKNYKAGLLLIMGYTAVHIWGETVVVNKQVASIEWTESNKVCSFKWVGYSHCLVQVKKQTKLYALTKGDFQRLISAFMSHAPGMTHCSLSSMNKGTGLTKFRTSIIKPLSKCENVSGLLILRTEPAPEFGRSHSFLRFLSW